MTRSHRYYQFTIQQYQTVVNSLDTSSLTRAFCSYEHVNSLNLKLATQTPAFAAFEAEDGTRLLH